MTPAERELAAIKKLVGAPKATVLLGCSTISHERLGFCSVCVGPSFVEVNGWRCLALIEAGQ